MSLTRRCRLAVPIVVCLALLTRPAMSQFGEAQLVALSVAAPKTVESGKSFQLTVRLKVDPGFHIQSNKPAPNYVPTTVKVTGPAGFTFGEPRFPPAEMARAAGEMIPVFSGAVEVIVPVTVPRGASGPVNLKVTCSYQACNEGSCFPPTDITTEAKVLIGVSPSKPPNATSQPGAKPVGNTGVTPTSPRGNSAAPPAKPVGTRPQAAPAASTNTTVTAPQPTTPSPIRGYTMAKITQFVGPDEFVRFLEGGLPNSGAQEAGQVSRLLQSGNLLLALPLIFLLGLALNLTPCVYPIIPITVSYFGSQTGKDGKKPLTLAAVYVLGMAVMYSALGVIAGMTGEMFGAQLQNPWVLLVFALIMFALALTQFDRPDGRPIWEFQLPGSLRNRAQSRSGVLGALFMGIMVGVVAAPCIGPAVIALLQWVGTQRSPMLGFGVFLSLSLGLGLPYLFLGAASGSVQRLPRAGEWMVGVKHLFGAVLVWMGFYYLEVPLAMVHPAAPKAVMVSVTALLAIYLLFLDKAGANVRGLNAFRRIVGLCGIGLAVWMAMPAPAERIAFRPYSEAAIERAIEERKPVLLDFTASWCAACRELEHKTFSDPRVGAASRRYVALRADMTNFRGPEASKWREKYGISGLPTVVRLTPVLSGATAP